MSTASTDVPAAESAEELVPGFRPARIRANLETQLEELRKAHDATYDLQFTFIRLLEDNPWPEGATLPNVDRFDLQYQALHIKIPPLVDPATGQPAAVQRPWRGLDGTAGIVYRLRKFLKIDKLQRSNTVGDLTVTVGADGSAPPPQPYTQFFGYTTFGQVPTPPDHNRYGTPTNRWSVYIYVDGQMPPTCRLEEVFGVDPTPRKHYRVVCK